MQSFLRGIFFFKHQSNKPCNKVIRLFHNKMFSINNYLFIHKSPFFNVIIYIGNYNKGWVYMINDFRKWSKSPQHSLILSLVLLNLCVISAIYKSGGVYFVQFLTINFCLYCSFKGYERYINYISDEPHVRYRIVQKKFFLEFFFIFTTIFSVAFAIYFDVKNLIFVNTFPH